MSKLSFEEYLEWHTANIGDDLKSRELSAKYEANVTVLWSTVNAHPFIAILSKRLSALAAGGVFQSGSSATEVSFNRKPFASVTSKIFRLNCLWNRNWPQQLKGGWIGYASVFSMIDDLVRTTLVCKYLDGPEYVSNEIIAAAVEAGLTGKASARATETGYYAWHTYIQMPAQVIIADKLIDLTVNIEFQATTQLQAALRELTHKLYEKERGSPPTARVESRWDYQSPRFRAEYLGHTLHLVDAMILELRQVQDGQKGETGTATPSIEVEK